MGNPDSETAQQQLDAAREELIKSKQLLRAREATISEQERTIRGLEDQAKQATLPAQYIGAAREVPSHTAHFIERQQLEKLQQELRQKTLRIDELEAKLHTHQHTVDGLFLSKRSEGTLLLEIEHLKADNQRLVGLLKQTEEFKDFSELAEAAGGIRYIPQSRSCKAKKCHGEVAAKELDDWVPSEAWRVAHDFLAKYGSSGFKSVHLNRLLEDMNRVWRERERIVITQVKAQCAREVKDLRRKLVNTPSYDQVAHTSQIKRLKGDLKKAHEDLRTISSARARAYAKPGEIEAVLRIASDFQHENKLLAFENSKLKGRSSEGPSAGGKAEYAMKQKVKQHGGRLQSAVQKLLSETRRQESHDPAVVHRRQEWLLENVGELVDGFLRTLNNV